MHKKKSFFIVFEGIEGSGKSYQSKKLYNNIKKRKLPVILTREPGGTVGAERIRNIILKDYFANNSNEKFHKYTDTLLYLAARNENYVQSLVKTYKGSGSFVCLGHGKNFDLFSSAIIAGTAAHGEDFDDTFEGNPIHVGASMIPAMLSAAQKFNLSGEQILKGLIVGSELICRLALVAPTAMHKQCFHPIAFIGQIRRIFILFRGINN